MVHPNSTPSPSLRRMHDRCITFATLPAPASTERSRRWRSSRYEQGQEAKRPLSKKTEALLEQLQRRRGVRDLPKRFLIVCEDHKSAPNYFEALKKHFNLSATSIQVVGSAGQTQPIQVVTRAVKLKENAIDPESGTEPFDEVWCVIHGDYGTKINNARTNQAGTQMKTSTNIVSERSGFDRDCALK